MDAEAPRERGMQFKVRGSDWSEVPTSQGAPRNTWDPQTLREARRSPSPQLSEGAAPSLTAPSQTSRLQSADMMNVVIWVQPRGSRCFVMAAAGKLIQGPWHSVLTSSPERGHCAGMRGGGSSVCACVHKTRVRAMGSHRRPGAGGQGRDFLSCQCPPHPVLDPRGQQGR